MASASLTATDENLSGVDRYKMKCKVLKEQVKTLERELTRHRVEAIKHKALEEQQNKSDQEPKDETTLQARRGGELKEIGGRLIDTLDGIVKREERSNREVCDRLAQLQEREEQILHLIMEHARLRVIPAAPPLPASPSTAVGAATMTVAAAAKAGAGLSPLVSPSLSPSPSPSGGKSLEAAVAAESGSSPAFLSPSASPTAVSPAVVTGSAYAGLGNDEALRNAELALALLKETKAEEVRIANEALSCERTKVESLQNLVRSLERGIREEKVKMVELKFQIQREKIPMPVYLIKLLGINRARGAQTQAELAWRGIVLDDTLSTSAPSSSPTLLAPSSFAHPAAVAQTPPQSVQVVVPSIALTSREEATDAPEDAAALKDAAAASGERTHTGSPPGESRWIRKQSSRQSVSKPEAEDVTEAAEPSSSESLGSAPPGGRRTLLSAGRQQD